MLRLSQGHLNLLETCPRKFQYQVLEQRMTPPSPEQQAAMQWGDRFHALMQQQSLGLPIEALLSQDPQLHQALSQLQQAAPQLFSPPPDSQEQSEHPRSLNIQGYPLTVIYDRLVTCSTHAEILDWKTHQRPLSAQDLARDWQTRLYCYVLAETSDYSPEQIRMTYYFVRAQTTQPRDSQPRDSQPRDSQPRDSQPRDSQPPIFHTLSYSHTAHLAIQQRLHHWITRLNQWLGAANPDLTTLNLPQVQDHLGHCRRCPFAERCDRQPLTKVGALEPGDMETKQAIADIPEIPI